MSEDRPSPRLALAVVLGAVAVSAAVGIWLTNAFTESAPTITADEAARIAADYGKHHTPMPNGTVPPYTVTMVEYEPDGWYSNRLPNGVVTARHRPPCSGGGFISVGPSCGKQLWYVRLEAMSGGRVWWEEVLVDAHNGHAMMGGGGGAMPSNLVSAPGA